MFDPFQLELGVTSDTVKETLDKHDYAKGIDIFILELIIMRLINKCNCYSSLF